MPPLFSSDRLFTLYYAVLHNIECWALYAFNSTVMIFKSQSVTLTLWHMSKEKNVRSEKEKHKRVRSNFNTHEANAKAEKEEKKRKKCNITCRWANRQKRIQNYQPVSLAVCRQSVALRLLNYIIDSSNKNKKYDINLFQRASARARPRFVFCLWSSMTISLFVGGRSHYRYLYRGLFVVLPLWITHLGILHFCGICWIRRH